MSATKPNARQLLKSLGVGDFNATAIIPYLMIAPATTDPKASQIILLVQHIQRALYALGATYVAVSGRLDAPTARALLELVGSGWERQSWGANVQAIWDAQKVGATLSGPAPVTDDSVPVAVGGPLDFLPDVPGGMLTYGIVGFLIYRHLKGKAAAR